METGQSRDDTHKQEMSQMQKERSKREKQAEETCLWSECSSVCQRLEQIQCGGNPNKWMMHNMALRVQKLERQLEIDPENSIVADTLDV